MIGKVPPPHHTDMEVPLHMREREEEEVMGMDLKTRKRSHSQPLPLNGDSPTSSSTSSESSSSSESSESNFEYAVGVENNHVNGTSNGKNSTITEGGSVNEEAEAEAEMEENNHDNGIIIGENPTITEGGSVNEEAEAEIEAEKEESSEEPKKVEEDEITVHSNAVSFSSTNEGTNGISFHQNGDTIAYSLPENKGGNQESWMNSSSLSDSPDIAVGLKDVGSLLDESSNNLNFTATDTYNALDDTLNNAPKSVENENGNLGLPEDPIPEIQEVDVGSMIQKHVFTLDNAPKSVENENGHLDLPKDPLPEVEEFDVERVVQKQETHDFYCPNCNSCITKRVILKRRKRKIEDISAGEDVDSSTPAQTAPPPPSDGILQRSPNANASVDGAADEPIYAITCLSCLSIFLPTENGWLRRIFGKKPEVPIQSDPSLTESLLPTHGGTDGGDASIDANMNYTEGNVFPLWIVNCCQPSEKRPVRPDIPVAPKLEPGHSERPFEDDANLGLPKPVKTDGDAGSDDEIKPYLPVADAPSLPPKREPPVPGTHTFEPIAPVQSEPRDPAVPNDEPPPKPKSDSDADMSLPHEPEPPLTPGKQLPVTKPASDHGYALWFLNCCQPYRDGLDSSLSPKPEPTPGSGVDANFTSEPKSPITSVKDTEPPPKLEPIPGQDTMSPSEPISPITPGGDTTLPPKLTHVTRPDGGTPLPNHPTPAKPFDDDKPLPPELIPPTRPHDITLILQPKSPVTTPTGGQLTIPMSDQGAPKTSPSTTGLSVIQPGDEPSGPAHDLEARLIDDSQELPRVRQGTGVDIIKAIVYGGLLECITSLSVITSAAGGDATTLNIVALGLANVFGGLVLLFHNLRVLKHEHGTERYIDQLGRPGHFCLHATVAVISYLIFGLMAPILYGFSFRLSDNKDYKLLTIAAAALVCITLLSTAKAYARKQGYTQTIFYYIGVGFSVSGVGYVTGHFINLLLKKLGVFDSRSASPEAVDMKGIWASY